MNENAQEQEPDRTEEYLALLNEYGKKINGYVFSLVKDSALAEDILQETRLLMWKNFYQYESNTNFLAWGRKMAFYQILFHRRKVKKYPTSLSDEVLVTIADEIENMETDSRHQALETCIQKLSETHRKIILMRYYDNLSIETIADNIQRPEGGIYRVLSRIRASLNECIQKNISKVLV